MDMQKSPKPMPVAVALLSAIFKLWAFLSVFVGVVFGLQGARWLSAGFVSGQRGGILSPFDSPVLIFVAALLGLGLLCYATARALKRRSYGARWMPFVPVLALMLLFAYIRTTVLILAVCGPLTVLSLLAAFLPSANAYFSGEESVESRAYRFGPVLALFCGFVWFAARGLIAGSRIENLCLAFPAGSSSERFVQASIDAGVDRVVFANSEMANAYEGEWNDRMDTTRRRELVEQYGLIKNGKASAMSSQFILRRIACQVEFQDKKVVRASILTLN